MIKRTIGFLCVLATACANAQIAPQHSHASTEQAPSPRHARSDENERVLPAVAINDASGQITDLQKIAVGGNWVLIVLDATMPSARAFLSALSSKEEALDERTTILIVGSAAATEKLEAEKNKLAGIRWAYSSDSSLIKQLHLAAVPSMMGIRSNQKIAWTFSGLPHRPELIASTIRGWLKLNPSSKEAIQ